MLNRCEFIGNLGADPEVRHTQSGRVVNMRLAVSEKWTSKDGEKKERTTWVPIVIWNDKLGEIAERYLKKGDRAYVSGAFSVRKWTDQSGGERYSTEVVLQGFDAKLVLLGGRNGERDNSPPSAAAADFGDEIPF